MPYEPLYDRKAAARKAAHMRRNPMSILLVEDNDDDTILIIRALQDGRISNPIERVHSAEHAMAYLKDTDHTAPILVMLDLKLNGKDGLWVLMQMRAIPALALLPVLVFTSSKQQEDMIRSYDSGANAYVRKPVDADVLRAVAADLGLFWQLTNIEPSKGWL